MKKKVKTQILSLNERHLAQLIRRRMIQKVRPSKKVYSRKNNRKGSDD